MSLDTIKRHYRINRRRSAVRLALIATSPYALLAAGVILAMRLHAKGISNPYELVETGALLVGLPVAWAAGVLVRDFLGRG